MKMKALFLLTLALFVFASAIATIAVTFEVSTPKLLKSIINSSGSGYVQPTGDPVDDPVLPM